MSLRLKLVVVLALLAAFSTAAIGLSSYVNTAEQLRSNIDKSLQQAEQAGTSFDPDHDPIPHDGPESRSLDYGVIEQTIAADGSVDRQPGSGALPVSAADVAVAGSATDGVQLLHDTSVDGVTYRVLTASNGEPNRGARMYARSLAESNDVLEKIRNRTALAVLVVTAVAALLGWLFARQATGRLQRLTGVAEEVASTGRLDVEVPVGGHDEAGRLGVAFNEMLGALARSKDAQQRLVQDAGHELRTPLTSLRTNVAVLQRYESLRPEDRDRLITDLDSETQELTALVNELVDLATDRRSDEPDQEVDLGPMIERVADRARRRTGRQIDVSVDATVVVGRPQALDRAITNLVDNAAKFSADAGGPIDISLHEGRVEVSDRGPGIAAADLPHVFDRFYRALDARSRPGSGLGLAIVSDVVVAHGGSTFASEREGGGATVGFVLPCVDG
ncbi:MAG: HAMP domain-containing sensor histidine kinase [Acidimicrobiales bacterium]